MKLIAEYHGGSHHAANRTDKPGVVFTVSIPLLDDQGDSKPALGLEPPGVEMDVSRQRHA
ncbi:MAG: hypothetical protein F4244_02560 [Gammaproteobacteria bacterium]|nr:hypothetical protein [Gammaproteobacteria bacterium]